MKTATQLCALLALSSALSAQSPPVSAPIAPTTEQDQLIDRDFAASTARNGAKPSASRQEQQSRNPSEPTSEATRVGRHRIGEALQEWFAISPNVLNVNACQSKRRGPLSQVDRFDCERIRALYGDGGEVVSRENNRIYTWEFLHGKLSRVSVAADLEAPRREDRRLDFQQELSFLTEAYGKPSGIQSVPYHNALGAQWERSIAQWDMPDGTTIFEYEQTAFDRQGDVLAITFISKEAAAKLLDRPAKSNPYQQ